MKKLLNIFHAIAFSRKRILISLPSATAPFFLLLLLFTAPLFFHSCGEGRFAKEIQGVDSLQQQVNKIEAELLKMDSTHLESISVTASNNVNRIKRVYVADTIDMVVAHQVTEYKALRKLASKARAQRGQLWTEIHISKNQLAKLKEDLENTRYEEQQGKKYYNDEKLATISLVSAYDAYVEKVNSGIKLYDSLNPEIEKIITEKEALLILKTK